MPVEIRALRPDDDTRDFVSDNERLNVFLQEYAKQNQFDFGLGVTYLAADEGILGYFTLSGGQVDAALYPKTSAGLTVGCSGCSPQRLQRHASTSNTRHSSAAQERCRVRSGRCPTPRPLTSFFDLVAGADDALELVSQSNDVDVTVGCESWVEEEVSVFEIP